MRVYENDGAARELNASAPTRDAMAFHRSMSGYTSTPLRAAPEIARSLGVGSVLVKDESQRMGLPAFKILGASWAVHYALCERLGVPPGEIVSFAELRQRVEPLRPLTLTTATDGNHGRAVARVAALLGLDAHILVPAGTAQARSEAIAAEGATVEVVAGGYDDAVELAARSADADERCLVVSDTSWPGYEQIPWRVIEGYSTIFWEIDDELARRGLPGPQVIVVQIGVGALAAAVVRHYRRPGLAEPPYLIGVEPTRAACVLASMEAGALITIPGPQDSIMVGLNAGTPSLVAWPLVSRGIDLFMAVEDDSARRALRLLAASGIVAGETGAAGLAGLLELRAEPPEDRITPHPDGGLRAHLRFDDDTRVLLISTEGATDPAAYRRIVDGESDHL